MSSEAENSRRRVRKPLFEYPALPEFPIYFSITFVALIYAWYCVYNASTKWTFRFGFPASVSTLPLLGERFRDEFDWEWNRWGPMAVKSFPFMILNSIVFNMTSRYCSERVWMFSTIIVSLITSTILFTHKLVIISLIQGTFVFVLTHYFRSVYTVWISSMPILYFIMHHTMALSPDAFLVLLFVSYTLLSYISFNIDRVKGFCRQNDKSLFDLYIRMLFYTFYHPYLVSLIVLYRDFEAQIKERPKIRRNWTDITVFALRLLFWVGVIELMLRYFYFGAILTDVNFAANLPKNEFVVMGMAIGNFFHLKYVIIFGIPSLFAKIDKMQPLDGPICISRIALYSKIWRGFDRGLYIFFKQYIFVPICAPTFSLPRKIVGVLVSYSFVLLWHGFQHHNIVWIMLNIIELFIEFTAKALYTVQAVKNFRESTISDRNFRRILGFCQIVPYAFGLYSNFYFLGGSKVGWLFVQRIFWEETVTLRWPFFLLIFCGYNYMHVTMEAEKWLTKRKNTKID
ncbi:unnamed protein product [Bursaphelenchus okinawaensis]|uniref:Uncharacterized protein n=1 Tax=Bursaphelenchus okinawaensis TaxID=465554 RepID=A0A811K8Y1_9BILA|nr:unnamed protein product [Bursaphelenchus okinawaensis]CAG9094523.1 unnamed protein product [Bursaphelenchus okinawaensis]